MANRVTPGILEDKEIARLAKEEGMIEPFEESLIREVDGRRVLSYGLSSMGYDIRADLEWYIASGAHIVKDSVLDPKDFKEVLMHKVVSQGGPVDLPAYSFALTHSVERFKMPKDVIGIAMGKSTYARVGLIVNITPLEPGWEGWLTIEVINPTPYPIRVYPLEGIAQIVFFRSAKKPMTNYEDRKGKYQGQEKRVVFAKV